MDADDQALGLLAQIETLKESLPEELFPTSRFFADRWADACESAVHIFEQDQAAALLRLDRDIAIATLQSLAKIERRINELIGKPE